MLPVWPAGAGSGTRRTQCLTCKPTAPPPPLPRAQGEARRVQAGLAARQTSGHSSASPEGWLPGWVASCTPAATAGGEVQVAASLALHNRHLQIKIKNKCWATSAPASTRRHGPRSISKARAVPSAEAVSTSEPSAEGRQTQRCSWFDATMCLSFSTRLQEGRLDDPTPQPYCPCPVASCTRAASSCSVMPMPPMAPHALPPRNRHTKAKQNGGSQAPR